MAKKEKKKKKRENATDDFSLDLDEGLDLEEGQEDEGGDLYFDGEEIKFWAEIIVLILFIAALADGVFGFKVIKTLMASV
jgi:hypothetical protein